MQKNPVVLAYAAVRWTVSTRPWIFSFTGLSAGQGFCSQILMGLTVQSSPVQSRSVQGDIHAFEEAHMHSTPFHRSFPERCRRKCLKGSVPPSEVMYSTTVAHWRVCKAPGCMWQNCLEKFVYFVSVADANVCPQMTLSGLRDAEIHEVFFFVNKYSSCKTPTLWHALRV